MEFCPKCGAVLIHKRKNDGCPRCNYSASGKIKLKTSEKMEDKTRIAVVKDSGKEMHPTITDDCKKCGNDEAYFWTVQTRASDEAETRFFKCVKCNHTWRSYM